MPALATILQRGDDDSVPVLAVLAVIIAWRYTIKGKGAPAARLAALLCAVIVALVLVSFKEPTAAGALAGGWFSGISAAATGLGHFLGDVFG
jgi:hypothetical protein